jgi:hypothetical protein
VCNQRKKTSTHTSHNPAKFGGKGQRVGLIYSQGRVFGPSLGMNRDECSTERHVPRAGALVPVDATNRDGCSEMNRNRYLGGTNRDRGLSLIPICEPNRDGWLLGVGLKTLFLLVYAIARCFFFLHIRFFLRICPSSKTNFLAATKLPFL